MLGSYSHMLSPALSCHRLRVSVVAGESGVASCRDILNNVEDGSLSSELSFESVNGYIYQRLGWEHAAQ